MAAMLVLFASLLNSTLFQTFTVVGGVRDVKGQAVTGVRISVFDENFQPIRTSFVDSSGRFTIRGLGSGRYQFKIETTGTPYQEQQSDWIVLQSLRIRRGGVEQYALDFVLKFKSRKEPNTRTGSVFAQDVPEAARVEYERGYKALKDNSPETGIASLKKALEIFPDYFDALELIGTEYVKGGQYEMALPFLQYALEINSRAPMSLYAIGVANLKLGQLKTAIEFLNKSAGFDPSNPNTQMMLGIAFGNNYQLTESEAAFRKALQLGGTALAEAHFYLAGIYDKQKKYGAAAKELELFLKESKDIKDPSRVKEMIRAMKEKERVMKP